MSKTSAQVIYDMIVDLYGEEVEIGFEEYMDFAGRYLTEDEIEELMIYIFGD